MSMVSEPIPAPARNPLRLQLPAAPVPAPRKAKSAAWRRLPWVLGIGLATVSLVGAGHVLQSKANDSPASSARDGKSSTVPAGTGAWCHGNIDVEGGILHLVPSQLGEIVEIPVSEGQMVKQGDLLLRVSEEPAQLAIKQAEAGVRFAEAQLEQARNGIEQLRHGLEEAQAGIDAANSKYMSAQSKFKRLESLISLNQSNQNDLDAARQEVNAYKAGQAAAEAKYRQTQALQPETKVREAEAGLELAKERVRAKKYELGQCSLKAPCDGIVVRLNASKGILITPQLRQHPVWLCPSTPRIVRGELLPEFAHRVQPGMDAIVHDRENANITWQGKVKRLADAFLPKREQGEGFSLNASDTKLLECIVELAPSQNPPRVGQQVRVLIGTRP